MASGIKTCPNCGGLYTGATDKCLGCIFRSHAPSLPLVKLSRAERRAAERVRSARPVQEADTIAAPVQRSHPYKKKPQKKHKPIPRKTSRPAGASKPSVSPPARVKRAEPVRPQPEPPRQPVYVQKRGAVPMPPQEPGLGTLALAEGNVRSEVGPAGRVMQLATVQCTCLGMNQDCFKCDGTGYCEVELLSSVQGVSTGTATRLTGARSLVDAETHFSNDSRGGEPYGIRERGRFGSNPLHDDHDE
jgi:hypothetical protein